MVNDSLQEISGWDKIRVEDGNKLSLGGFQSLGQCTGFKSLSIVTVVIRHRKTLRRVVVDKTLRHGDGLIRGVIEKLNVQLVFVIFEMTNRVQ